MPKSPSAAGFLALAYAYLLAFNLLQQLTATTHAPVAVPYLFLAVIDGFIAFALFAWLRLSRTDPVAEIYPWTLTVLAIIVRGITVLVLGVLGTRHSPGSVWQPDDTAVTWLSVIAPLVLFCAVHLYALLTEDAADCSQAQGGDAR